MDDFYDPEFDLAEEDVYSQEDDDIYNEEDPHYNP
jgi:hypothetical protein